MEEDSLLNAHDNRVDLVDLIFSQKYIKRNFKDLGNSSQDHNINAHLPVAPPNGLSFWTGTRPSIFMDQFEDNRNKNFTDFRTKPKHPYSENFYSNHVTSEYDRTRTKRPILPIMSYSLSSLDISNHMEKYCDVVKQAIQHGLVSESDYSMVITNCPDLIENAINCIHQLNFIKNSLINMPYSLELRLQYESMDRSLKCMKSAINDQLLNFKSNGLDHLNHGCYNFPSQNIIPTKFGANCSNMVNQSRMFQNNLNTFFPNNRGIRNPNESFSERIGHARFGIEETDDLS